FFCFRTPPPPISTLFPYTTLFRSAAPADYLLPDFLLLRRREKHRQFAREVRIEAVLVEPLHESTERQDIRRFPDRKCFPALESIDRKSTRLNSSHVSISYAVFCLK